VTVAAASPAGLDDDVASPLGRELVALIEAHGPIDVATFMALALGHPTHGYYSSRAALGAGGDFVTAPEASQLFGELIGAALATAWQQAGGAPARLVELGPGNGTLLADLWRATAGVKGFHAALDVHLVETSPLLRRRQAERLGSVPGLAWHAALDEVPADRPLLVVANEFLDALPIRQLIRLEDGWHEIQLGLDARGRLAFAPDPRPSPLALRLPAAPIGSVLELSPAREAAVAGIAHRLADQGGLTLVVDYGERDPAPGSTLQAVTRHRRVDPLTRPGEVDLTSRVHFAPLINVAGAAGPAVFGPVPQGLFLQRLGIDLRLGHLLAGASAAAATGLRLGHARLTEPAAMGELFQVLAIDGWGNGPPAGFVAAEANAPVRARP
jgi:NADH dehydrogenase [ubiquinone] 1 alpha subcomplex assembly factor 7